MLAVPLIGGQAVLEMHLNGRFLAEETVPNRKKRVKHTFLMRDGEKIVEFTVVGRVKVRPAWVALAMVRRVAEAIATKEAPAEAILSEMLAQYRTQGIEVVA